jgi:hypothetical protein
MVVNDRAQLARIAFESDLVPERLGSTVTCAPSVSSFLVHDVDANAVNVQNMSSNRNGLR